MAIQQTFCFFDAATEVGAEMQAGGRKKKPAARKVNAGKANVAVERVSVTTVNATVRDTTPGSPVTTTVPVAAPPPQTREAVLNRLRSQAGCIQHADVTSQKEVFSAGCAGLDRLLPSGGLKLDSLTEWVGQSDCSGAATLSLAAVASVLTPSKADSSQFTRTGPVVVVDLEGTFYPPAADALGIPAGRIVWVRPRRHADAVWAIDQALRCESVAVVWASVGARLDDRDARRFQLAAEMGRTPGLLVRPAVVRRQPSFAEVRFAVAAQAIPDPSANASPASRTLSSQGLSSQGLSSQALSSQALARLWRVTLDRCRGASVGAAVWVEMNERAELRTLVAAEITKHEKASAVHLASRLADPTAIPNSATEQPATRRHRA